MELKNFVKDFSFEFKNEKLLETALSHRSFTQETKTNNHNERLEFLGDAVIDLVLSDLLMKTFPGDDEGKLSKKRASLVNEKSLSAVAADLNIGNHIKLGKGEKKAMGHEKSRILASGYEALIGAAYLDQGFDAVRNLIKKHFSTRFENQEYADEDYKTQLQEETQRLYKAPPEYRLISEKGPSHKKIFQVKLYVQGKEISEGGGNSKKVAEQMAAKNALQKLKGGVK
jgi:ribonuclease-3